MKKLLCIALAAASFGGSAVSADGAVTGSILVVDKSGEPQPGRADFVVFIEGNDPTSRAALLLPHDSRPRPHVSHRDSAFAPRVLVVETGTTVDFTNDDRIFHNAFSLSKAKPFDLGIYPVGTSKLVTFDQPGLVRVYCNIHPKMISNILVLENSFFSITSTDGQYAIEAVPDGAYTIRVWAERADPIERSIVVNDGRPIVENFTAVTRRQFPQHRNKFGKPYRSKY